MKGLVKPQHSATTTNQNASAERGTRREQRTGCLSSVRTSTFLAAQAVPRGPVPSQAATGLVMALLAGRLATHSKPSLDPVRLHVLQYARTSR